MIRKIDIKGKIRSTIRKSEGVDYIVSCFERRRDKRFCLFARNQSTDTVFLEPPTDVIHKERELIYFIRSGNSFSGFGAELRRTLDALFFADFYGFVPVVEYDHNYIYSERVAVNGVKNPYEYYFEQPAGIPVVHVNQCVHIFYKEEHRALVRKFVNNSYMESPYQLSEKYIRVLGNIVKKYICLNSIQKEYIESSFKEINLFKTQIIGVHYRGTDFKYGYRRHPKVLRIDDYYNAVDTLLNKSDSEIRIFLATDEEEAVGLFKERYGNKIIYFFDTYRSKNGEPVHFSKDFRELHNYRLGQEILRDIIALSYCDYLISGLSQVSYCARIFKRSYDAEYIDKIILSNGIN